MSTSDEDDHQSATLTAEWMLGGRRNNAGIRIAGPSADGPAALGDELIAAIKSASSRGT